MKPSSRILRPAKFKTAVYLGGSGAFVAVGLWMVSSGASAGWFCTIFFGLCVLVFAINLLPGSSFLIVDDRGFTVRSLYRGHFYQWSEVGDFRVGAIGSNKMVLFNFSDDYRRSFALGGLATALTGAEGALPSSYGLTHEALADLMNETRASALANVASQQAQ